MIGRLTYAIGDLHGRFDLLQEALARIEQQAAVPGRVLFLGDYVDRGPRSRQVLDRLMSGPPPGWTWLCLKGNHDAMMVDALAHGVSVVHWLDSGGVATIASYADLGDASGEALRRHILWIDRLPVIRVEEHRLYVHGGIDRAVPLADQNAQTLMWHRWQKGDEAPVEGRHVVHGHTPFPHGPLHFAGRTNLDTFAWKTGRIAVGIFDDDSTGGPIGQIEILA